MTHRDDITEAVAGVYRLIDERLDQHGAPDGETVVERLEAWARREAEFANRLARAERERDVLSIRVDKYIREIEFQRDNAIELARILAELERSLAKVVDDDA